MDLGDQPGQVERFRGGGVRGAHAVKPTSGVL